jgi:hypothetical protein
MKRIIPLLVALALTTEVAGQVTLRNDFIINRKLRKMENRGLTFISINLSNHPNWNYLFNGRGGRTLLIDVRAIRQKKVVYTYRELAERVYTPNFFTNPLTKPVPEFLLVAPRGPRFQSTFEFKGFGLPLNRMSFREL